ncbi:MAG: N-6 DNA methylase [Gammaproteobacteria bacterium]|nr:N-6 DNA methylase [Gammaproteobacteria bacterium]MYH45144.1 N-6 DNA methylase [Gammaproteobacteria bacterium]
MPEQLSLDLDDRLPVNDVLRRIRDESRDESEKGHWFEQLFMHVAMQEPRFELEGIWRWKDWPERESLTGLHGGDIGIDLVAKRTSGEWIAIQCKCYDDRHVLGKGGIDKFLGGSQQDVWGMRWLVATCRLGPNADSATRRANPPVAVIDFKEFLHVQLEREDAKRPEQEPWPLQFEAIGDVVEGLGNHDRGRLVMACGTGKTFTALRISERIVAGGGRILFAAPSIALVSQARREWLRHTRRKLTCLVVCSDPTAGGRNENEDIGLSELECPVSSRPEEIAERLKQTDYAQVVFCTYQSLDKVIAAQADYGAPEFNLAISDEAHRTTGVSRSRGKSGSKAKVDFQSIHDGCRLLAEKRLYMTATPRIYTQSSKTKLAERGIEVIDMSDQDVYGPLFHQLTFKQAVDNEMLSDYRVIVLGVDQGSVTPGLRRRLEQIDSTPNEAVSSGRKRNPPGTREMTRVLGVSLALNGVARGSALERSGPLQRAMAFANSIPRSKWFAESLMESQVLAFTTRQKRSGRALKLVARHLDASSSALRRNQELRELRSAGEREDECRVLCNVKLFTEGVDVPQLDAVAFLEPRDSQIDVVQAVGRVMRKAPGKRLGYIVIPVVVEPGADLIESLVTGTEGFQGVGRVLRALQAHDGRLAEDPARFVKAYQATDKPPGIGEGGEPYGNDLDGLSKELDLRVAGEGIYAHIAAASGLGKPGQLVADDIGYAVKRASAIFQEEELEGPLADALDLVPENDGGAKGVCTVAALMLCNACLLQRRLRDEPEMKTIMRLDKVAGSSNPAEILSIAWESILEKDYAPVFRPALAVTSALRVGKSVNNAIRGIAECANRVADSLSELGYDHAGPLYHRILGSAKSDGAFYTNNLSAIVLARLAFPDDFIDWTDSEAVSNLKVMDPACGTGTLLMAVLRTVKDRVAARNPTTTEQQNALHRSLVEDVLCGLDINQHGVQLAACNLTLGAPTVDYQRMNLVTMPHGPQSDGSVRAGSLEILAASDEMRDLRELAAPRRDLGSLDAEQVDASEAIRFPLNDLDAVIMNAPFTANENRSRKYGDAGRKAMQDHELAIQKQVEKRDRAAEGVITSNTIQTFFSPLADMLLNRKTGVLAKVVPTAVCTGTSSLAQRRFLAERFHIEIVVTSHDPKHPNFSENTSIHESLLICRRKTAENRDSPTRFHSLRRMPRSRREAIELVDAIQRGDAADWATVFEQPEQLVRKGDWRPCQFLDPILFESTLELENSGNLIPLGSRYPLGPAGRRIRDAFSPAQDEEGYRIFWSRARDLRKTMEAIPEQVVTDKKPNLAQRYRNQSGHLLLAAKFRTDSGRLLAIHCEKPSLGSMWVPVRANDLKDSEAKALCAWFNSTLGAIGFLASRGAMLTNPTFSQAELSTLPIPDFRKSDPAVLAKAYDLVRNVPINPWKEAANDEVRDILDSAAAETAGVGLAWVRDLRNRASSEPTIANRQA